jgi:hypothetical protein
MDKYFIWTQTSIHLPKPKISTDKIQEFMRCHWLFFFLAVVPVVEEGCKSDVECDAKLACIARRCQDPCNCGPNAICEVINHRPICRCRPGFEGNPNIGCEESKCQFSLLMSWIADVLTLTEKTVWSTTHRTNAEAAVRCKSTRALSVYDTFLRDGSARGNILKATEHQFWDAFFVET